MTDLRALREAVALLVSTDFDLAAALTAAMKDDDSKWQKFCNAVEESLVASRDVLAASRTRKCETHNALAHPPTGAEMCCHVWVIAGYAGWEPKDPCCFVSAVVLEVTE